jgi:hypothetical protein
MNRWTPAEDAILRAAWDRGPLLYPVDGLTHRSRWSLWRRVHTLGLKPHKPYWTAAEDAQLRELWNSGDRIVEIAKAMDRPEAGIYERAQKIGLQLGCPPGFEYLSAAAKRAGVATSQLRERMKQAGLPIHVATTKRRGYHGRKRRHFVDPVDVDAAMAKWNEAETVSSVARRLGLCAWTLSRKLRAVGCGSSRTHNRQQIRVTEADLRKIGVCR